MVSPIFMAIRLAEFLVGGAYKFAELPGVKVFNLARLLDIWLTLTTSCFRVFTGAWVADGVKDGSAKRPTKALILYEYEACPFCKKVREICSWLDLELQVFPAPRQTLKEYGVLGNSRYRPVVLKEGGKVIFPYLVDPNTDTKMYDSAAIIEYLFLNYGQGCSKPFTHAKLPGGLNLTSLFLANMFRPLAQHGMLATPSKLPKKPLELWQYEASSYCKIVREVLCTLELPYVCHNIARGSPKRAEFLASKGKLQFPYFEDPNTGVKMFDSDKIVAYLRATYQEGEVIKESFSDYSTKGASSDHGTIGGSSSTQKKQM